MRGDLTDILFGPIIAIYMVFIFPVQFVLALLGKDIR